MCWGATAAPAGHCLVLLDTRDDAGCIHCVRRCVSGPVGRVRPRAAVLSLRCRRLRSLGIQSFCRGGGQGHQLGRRAAQPGQESHFPVELLPWVTVLSGLFHLAISVITLLVVVVGVRGGVPWSALALLWLYCPLCPYCWGWGGSCQRWVSTCGMPDPSSPCWSVSSCSCRRCLLSEVVGRRMAILDASQPVDTHHRAGSYGFASDNGPIGLPWGIRSDGMRCCRVWGVLSVDSTGFADVL